MIMFDNKNTFIFMTTSIINLTFIVRILKKIKKKDKGKNGLEENNF